MSKLAIVHERTSTGDWRPVGVLLGTPKRLDMRFLKGLSGWETWGQNIAASATPPYRDGTGTTSPDRGTWEDWIDWACDNLGKGSDTWLTLIEHPEPSVEANFNRYVLKADPGTQSPGEQQPTGDLPPLEGYRKVRPA